MKQQSHHAMNTFFQQGAPRSSPRVPPSSMLLDNHMGWLDATIQGWEEHTHPRVPNQNKHPKNTITAQQQQQ
eukprot:2434678-Ditylum_brightwellii.AAC.1